MLPRLAGWVIIWTAGVRYDHGLVHLNINHHKSENVSHHQIIFSPNHFKWKTDYNFPPLVFMFSLSFWVLIDLNVLRSEKWSGGVGLTSRLVAVSPPTEVVKLVSLPPVQPPVQPHHWLYTASLQQESSLPNIWFYLLFKPLIRNILEQGYRMW